MQENIKHFVYIAQSEKFATEIYKGYTVNVDERIIEHNLGQSKHTNKCKP